MRTRIILCMALATPMAHALSLEESVASAIDSNPRIVRQYARFESVMSDRDSARGEYFPQVSVQAGIGREDTQWNSGQYFDRGLTPKDLGLRVSQFLFDGFRTPANVKRLSKEAESERQRLLSEVEYLARDVSQTYLETQKASAIAELSSRLVQDHEQVMEDVRGQLQKGYASESDIAQVASRLAFARSSLRAAESTLADQRIKLQKMIGRNPGNLSDPRVDMALFPANADAATTYALQNHPELAAARADIEAVEQERRSARAGYWPKLSVEYELNHDKNTGGYPGRDEDNRIMLVMNYDIFNGGRDQGRSAASGWRKHEATALSENTQLQVREDVALSWNAWSSLNDQLPLLQSSVDAATAAEAGYITQYRLGRRSLLDVLNANVELFVARKNYIGAKYDATLAACRLFNSMGILSYALRVQRPERYEEEVN